MWSSLFLLLGVLGAVRATVPRKTRIMGYLAVRASVRALGRAMRRGWRWSETVQEDEEDEGPPEGVWKTG